MIAESNPKEKDIIIKVIVNLINQKNYYEKPNTNYFPSVFFLVVASEELKPNFTHLLIEFKSDLQLEFNQIIFLKPN